MVSIQQNAVFVSARKVRHTGAPLSGFVADNYESPRRITPELLEFSDAGIRPICTWTKKLGYVIEFDS